MKKLGVTAIVKYHQDYDELMPLVRKHKLDAFIELFIFSNHEASSRLNRFVKSKENYANVDSHFIDEGLNEVWKTQSSPERFKIYQKINSQMIDESIVFGMYYLNHRNVVSDCLENISEDFAFNPFYGLANLTKKKGCE